MDRIELTNMVFFAYHGVYAEEQRMGQRFYIDLEVGGDFQRAGKADDLSGTVDYTAVYAKVKEVVETKRFQLLEALAEVLAEEVLAFPLVEEVAVRIRKPSVPLPGPLDYVQVQIRRSRGE